MKKWISVEQVSNGINDTIIINTDNISIIHEGSGTLIMNGVIGNENGVIKITKESMQKVILLTFYGREFTW